MLQQRSYKLSVIFYSTNLFGLIVSERALSLKNFHIHFSYSKNKIRQLTKSTQTSPSWEADRFSASQETLRILWNPKVHYRIHKSPPPALFWARSIHSIPRRSTPQKLILILSSHTCLGLPSALLPSGFPTKTLYVPLLSHIRATCPAHVSVLD